MFFKCDEVKHFWNDFVHFFTDFMPSQTIELEHVIFGLLETDCEIINFCVLHAKWFMYIQLGVGIGTENRIAICDTVSRFGPRYIGFTSLFCFVGFFSANLWDILQIVGMCTSIFYFLGGNFHLTDGKILGYLQDVF